MSIRTQEWIGSLIAAAGVVWAVALVTSDFSTVDALRVPPAGPLEVCGAGVVVWLVAKWRRSVQFK